MKNKAYPCLRRTCVSAKKLSPYSGVVPGLLLMHNNTPFSLPFPILSLRHTVKADMYGCLFCSRHHFIHIESSKQPSQVDYFRYPPLQKRKLRHRKVRYLAQVTKLVNGDALVTGIIPQIS